MSWTNQAFWDQFQYQYNKHCWLNNLGVQPIIGYTDKTLPDTDNMYQYQCRLNEIISVLVWSLNFASVSIWYDFGISIDIGIIPISLYVDIGMMSVYMFYQYRFDLNPEPNIGSGLI